MKFILAILATVVGLASAQIGGSDMNAGPEVNPSLGGGSGGSGEDGGDLGLGGGSGGCTPGAQPCTVDEQDKCCSGKCNEIAKGNGFCEKTSDEK